MTSSVGRLVQEQEDAKKALLDQMGGLDEVMTSSQTTWFRGVLKDKQRLTGEIQKLEGLVGDLVASLESQTSAAGEKTSGWGRKSKAALGDVQAKLDEMAAIPSYLTGWGEKNMTSDAREKKKT